MTESFNPSPSRGFYLLLACPGSNRPGLCLTAQLNLIQSQIFCQDILLFDKQFALFLQGSLFEGYVNNNIPKAEAHLISYLI